MIALDIAPEELALNQDAHERVVGDACRPLPRADVIASCCVIEHLQDVEAFVANSFRALPPGGTLVSMFPNKYAPFSVINRLLPHDLSRKILFLFKPQNRGFGGFRAYYQHCSPSQFRSLLQRHGFSVEEEVFGFYQSPYYEAIFPAFALSALYELLVLKLGLNELCAHYVVVAKKSVHASAPEGSIVEQGETVVRVATESVR